MNFVARPEDERPFFERMTAREVESVDEIGRPLRPKVAHRASPRATVGRAATRSAAPRAVADAAGEPLITVLHFPRRTFAQYRHKVEIGGATPGYDHKTIVAAHTALQYGRLEERYRDEASRTRVWGGRRLRDFFLASEKWEALLSTHGRHH